MVCMKNVRERNIIIATITVVAALFLIFGYFYVNKISVKNSDLGIENKNEAKDLAQKVGQLMFLPKNETPTIATVADPGALRNQSFFIDAKKGDKVLIYKKAKKAILYDPNANKIITIAPLSLGESEERGTNANPPSDAEVLKF